MDLREYVAGKALEARAGARQLGKASGQVKKRVLVAMAAAIRGNSAAIISENTRDVAAARQKGLSEAMIDRLTLNDKRIEEIAVGLFEVSELKDPVGEVSNLQRRPNDMM
ncbi:gamma-glutamyl phosphate reductase, partial [Candidatus Magnetobacterium bavaricum]